MTQLNESDVELKRSMTRNAADGTKTWRHTVKPDAEAAAAFLNTNPAQGPGEATLTTRTDGQIDVVFLM
ncbi:hypothetical protein [Kitasatospora sp. KL5]|uniref:hypothetical protein n=1 Tax=Kitasatospora sp. KL5 TaxID=3425125 RepID=UPI003D6EC0BC